MTDDRTDLDKKFGLNEGPRQHYERMLAVAHAICEAQADMKELVAAAKQAKMDAPALKKLAMDVAKDKVADRVASWKRYEAAAAECQLSLEFDAP